MPENPLPLYHKVYLLLRQRLESGQFEADKPMPNENTLAAEYGVSRLTVRRSLATLEAEGLVLRKQGRGTYPICALAWNPPQRGADIEGLLSHLSDMGMQTDVELIELRYESPSPAIAHQLELPAGMQVQRSVRVRRYNGQPFSYLTAYVPSDIGERFGREELESTPLLDIFRRLGIRIAGAEQTVTAVLADLDTAKPLGLPPGSALLSIRRLVRDDQGRPVEYLIAAYRPDRYEYRSSMRACKTAGSSSWVPAETSPAT